MADPLDFPFTPKLKKVQKLFYSLKKNFIKTAGVLTILSIENVLHI